MQRHGSQEQCNNRKTSANIVNWVGARNKPGLGKRPYLYSLAATFSSLAQTMSVLDSE